MAIKRGIEKGDVLLKRKLKGHIPWNYSDQMTRYTIDSHPGAPEQTLVLELHNRRSRTYGALVTEDVALFLRRLNVRLIEVTKDGFYMSEYTPQYGFFTLQDFKPIHSHASGWESRKVLVRPFDILSRSLGLSYPSYRPDPVYGKLYVAVGVSVRVDWNNEADPIPDHVKRYYRGFNNLESKVLLQREPELAY